MSYDFTSGLVVVGAGAYASMGLIAVGIGSIVYKEFSADMKTKVTQIVKHPISHAVIAGIITRLILGQDIGIISLSSALAGIISRNYQQGTLNNYRWEIGAIAVGIGSLNYIGLMLDDMLYRYRFNVR